MNNIDTKKLRESALIAEALVPEESATAAYLSFFPPGIVLALLDRIAALERVAAAAKDVYEKDDVYTSDTTYEDRKGRDDRDQRLGNALEALIPSEEEPTP